MTPFGCQISLGVARRYGTWHYCLARNGIFSLPWCKNVDFPNPLGCWSACSTGCSNGSLLLSSIPEDTSSLTTFNNCKKRWTGLLLIDLRCLYPLQVSGSVPYLPVIPSKTYQRSSVSGSSPSTGASWSWTKWSIHSPNPPYKPTRSLRCTDTPEKQNRCHWSAWSQATAMTLRSC